MANKLSAEFFARDSKTVAKDLIGKRIVRQFGDKVLAGTILKTKPFSEAGPQTVNKNGLSRAPGMIYIMPFRGHMLLNIATDKEGVPSCVMISELATVEGTVAGRPINGPGKVSKFLDMNMGLDSTTITGDSLWIEE